MAVVAPLLVQGSSISRQPLVAGLFGPRAQAGALLPMPNNFLRDNIGSNPQYIRGMEKSNEKTRLLIRSRDTVVKSRSTKHLTSPEPIETEKRPAIYEQRAAAVAISLEPIWSNVSCSCLSSPAYHATGQ